MSIPIELENLISACTLLDKEMQDKIYQVWPSLDEKIKVRLISLLTECIDAEVLHLHAQLDWGLALQRQAAADAESNAISSLRKLLNQL